ncbi:probable transcription-associated protein 1 [Condylostylus longicornis]|uniref:probable transcription-associated protein 1 n=1 Tax=Condylostylus longicornis TaxID=2530218 RepID=UPI00244D9B36|nr:probable transcription-associated protein 1 [Condylostylus longicornis]
MSSSEPQQINTNLIPSTLTATTAVKTKTASLSTTQKTTTAAAIKIATPIIPTIATTIPTKLLDDINLNSVVISSSEEFIVVPGPDDILIYNSSDGLYQQSVTLTARMWPPVEQGPPTTLFWGLPPIIWGIIIGFLIIVLVILAGVFICFWLLPRKHKFLSPTRFCVTSPASGTDTMAHRSSIVSKPWTDANGRMIIPIGLVPPQYSAPPPPPPQVRLHSNNNQAQQQQQYQSQIQQQHIHQQQTHQSIYQQQHHQQSQQHHQQYQQQQQQKMIQSQQQQQPQYQYQQQTHYQQRIIEYPMSPGGSISPADSKYSIIPDTHKSMWALNPLCGSNSILYENDPAYKSRSLPSWGKKQRPVSTADDLDELYAKVNFSKKRRNRMRNGEAAIIALCRSRSQNLQGLALERDGVVIYDERTAL